MGSEWVESRLKTTFYSNGDRHYASGSYRGSQDILRGLFAITIALLAVTAGGLGAQETATSEVATLRPNDGAPEDEFGYSIAVSGDTMAVGARFSGGAGAVFVYRRNEGGPDQWGLSAKIVAADGAEGDRFGQAVALQADTLAVGASGDDDINPTTAPGSTELFASGSVYIFQRDRGTGQWAQTVKLVSSDGVILDNFGYRLSLSGDVLAVTAWSEDDSPGVGDGSARAGNDSGSVYILERNPATGEWSEVTKINSQRTPATSDEALFDNFAKTIAVDGDTLVVGASEEDPNDVDQGSAYVFERNAGGANQWGEVTRLRASDGARFDRFGTSTAISGDTIVVGATGDDDAGSGAGTAFVFDRQDGQWVETAKLVAADGSDRARFGAVVSIDGDTIIVGAPQEDEKGNDAGAVYIFQRDTEGEGGWLQEAKLTAGDATAEDQFGATVAVGGGFVVSGAFRNDVLGESSGSAYLFQLGGEPSSAYEDVFDGGGDLGGGWHFSGWFGFYNVNFMPWIFHLQHEWMFLTQESVSDSTFLYDLSSQGWFFTGSTQYPNLFSFVRNAWVFYFEETSGPATLSTWEQVSSSPSIEAGPMLPGNFTPGALRPDRAGLSLSLASRRKVRDHGCPGAIPCGIQLE